MNNKKSRRTNVNQVLPVPKVGTRGWNTAATIRLSSPELHSSRDRIVVRNRELVQTISATFSSGTAPTGGSSTYVGFGASSIWPSTSWLYNIANNYDKYIIRKFKLSFQPVLPVTTGGTLGLWFDSDAENNTAPANYGALSGNMNVETGSIFNNLSVDVKTSQLNRLPQYLTLNNGAAPGTSSATVGTLKLAYSPIISSNGSLTGSQAIGYIWVDYEVEFLNPSSPAT